MQSKDGYFHASMNHGNLLADQEFPIEEKFRGYMGNMLEETKSTGCSRYYLDTITTDICTRDNHPPNRFIPIATITSAHSNILGSSKLLNDETLGRLISAANGSLSCPSVVPLTTVK